MSTRCPVLLVSLLAVLTLGSCSSLHIKQPQAPTATAHAMLPTPTTIEPSSYGHPYFPLRPQAYWRYAIAIGHGDKERTPQEPAELRVASIESNPVHTVATLTYTPDLTYGSGTGTCSVDSAAPIGLCGSCPTSRSPLPFHFYCYLPPADKLVPGFSWSGCSSGVQGSSGGYRYSATYTVMAAEPVVFQGRQYEGLQIKQVEVEEILPGGGVTIYNKITAKAEKVYMIELARGIGIVRRVAGKVHCLSDAPTTQEHAEACDGVGLTVDYELLEFGTR